MADAAVSSSRSTASRVRAALPYRRAWRRGPFFSSGRSAPSWRSSTRPSSTSRSPTSGPPSRTSTISGLSWVLNAYNIVFASFLIVFGRLADLLGRRRLFTAGIALFTLASVWCAAAGSLDLLVVARMAQAAGAAMLVPASLAVVVEAFPADRRGHAVSLWGASAAVAAGLGPPIGGALVELGGWRLAFLVNLPIGAVAWWVAGHTLVESRAPGHRRMPDVRGALLLAGALSLLTLGIVQGDDWGWSSPAVLGSLAGAGGAGDRLRRELARAPAAAARPGAAEDPAVRHRERPHGRRRDGLLRLHAHQHPLAAVRLALRDPPRRPGPRPGRARRRGGRGAARPGGPGPRLPPGAGARSAGVGRGLRLVRRRGRPRARVLGTLAARPGAQRDRRRRDAARARQRRAGRRTGGSFRHRVGGRLQHPPARRRAGHRDPGGDHRYADAPDRCHRPAARLGLLRALLRHRRTGQPAAPGRARRLGRAGGRHRVDDGPPAPARAASLAGGRQPGGDRAARPERLVPLPAPRDRPGPPRGRRRGGARDRRRLAVPCR